MQVVVVKVLASVGGRGRGENNAAQQVVGQVAPYGGERAVQVVVVKFSAEEVAEAGNRAGEGRRRWGRVSAL